MSTTYQEMKTINVDTLRTLYENTGFDLFTKPKVTPLGIVHTFSFPKLAMYIFRTTPVVTMRDSTHMYLYNNETGEYQMNGFSRIESAVQEILGEGCTKKIKADVVDHIKTLSYRDRESATLPLNYIPVANGILRIPPDGGNWDFTKIELIENSPEHFVINRISTPFILGVTCPEWIEILNRTLPDPKDILKLQEYFGYSLLRDPRYHKALVLQGPARTGKSTIMDILRVMLGTKNCSSVPMHDLTDKFRVTMLYGKLANILGDMAPREIRDPSKFKQMVGGDAVPMERKYEMPFNAVLYNMWLWSVNDDLPPFKYDDDAVWARLDLILFRGKQYFLGDPATDPALKYKLYPELPGILNWSLTGLARLMKQKHFTNGLDKVAVRTLWHQLSDMLGQFMYSKYTTLGPELTCTKDELYNAYVAYCMFNSLTPWSKEKLGREISLRFKGKIHSIYPGKKGEQVYSWKGVSVSINEDDDIGGMFR